MHSLYFYRCPYFYVSKQKRIVFKHHKQSALIHFLGKLCFRFIKGKENKKWAPKSFRMKKAYFLKNNSCLMHLPNQWTNLPTCNGSHYLSPLSSESLSSLPSCSLSYLLHSSLPFFFLFFFTSFYFLPLF